MEDYAEEILKEFVDSGLSVAKFEPEKVADVMRRVVFKKDFQVDVYEKGKTVYLIKRGTEFRPDA